ncbi:MAG: WD40/YVTN/BNR-like repeat-containing protein [Acidimicrobiales bacterium]
MTGSDDAVLEAVRRTLAARAAGLADGGAPPLQPASPRRVRVPVAVAGVVFLGAGVLAGVRAWDGWSGSEVRVVSAPTTSAARVGSTIPVLTAPALTTTSVPVTVSVPVLGASTTAPEARASTTVASGVAGEAVPAGYGPRAVSFITPDLGWAVGAWACGAGSYCGAVVRTSDGGRSWVRVGNAPANLTMIGFVDARHGWAMGPQLYATDDGGATWREVAVPSGRPAARATAIQAGGGVAYLQTMGDDNVWRLYRATSADPRWVALPELTEGLGPLSAQRVVMGGGTAWLEVVAGDTTLYYSSTDGLVWERREDVPCRERGGLFAMAEGSVIVAVCRRADLQSSAGGIWVSRDGGRRFDLVADGPLVGPVWGLGAGAGMGTVVASGPANAELYTGVLRGSFDGGRTWARVAQAANGGRFGDIRFLTADRAVVIEDGFPSPSVLWRTEDGGRTWRPVVF